SNSFGNLASIRATLTVNGGSDGKASLGLDDTADGQSVSGTITSTTIDGLDMPTLGTTGNPVHSIVYSNLKTLALALGNGAADTLTLTSTNAGTTTNLALGNGNGTDTVTVSNASHMVDTIQGSVTVTGGTATGVLTVDDSGDTLATNGALGGANDNQITGF